jgi:hypothetical protein
MTILSLVFLQGQKKFAIPVLFSVSAPEIKVGHTVQNITENNNKSRLKVGMPKTFSIDIASSLDKGRRWKARLRERMLSTEY